MTKKQKRTLLESADAAGEPAGVEELERIFAWAESIEHDGKMLQEILAGRLAVRIAADGTRRFVQIGPGPGWSEEVKRVFDREYAAGG